MITKVVHGWRPAGLLAYLLGPGTAEVHRAPRVIATWDGLDAGWQPEQTGPSEYDLRLGPLVDALHAPAVAAGLPTRAPGGDARRGYVWHCSARLAESDRVLSDEQWADIARELLDGAGIAARDDLGGPRWVAIRHADDHIHIAAVLVRQDSGRRFWPHHDFPKLRATARGIEQRLGLTVTARADRTAARRPHRGEVEKAARQSRGPARPELRRAAQQAAIRAGGPDEFVATLREMGYLAELRRAPSGDPLGYKIARPGDVTAAGQPVFYSGSKLAPDLSLPQLRRRWAQNLGRQGPSKQPSAREAEDVVVRARSAVLAVMTAPTCHHPRVTDREKDGRVYATLDTVGHRPRRALASAAHVRGDSSAPVRQVVAGPAARVHAGVGGCAGAGRQTAVSMVDVRVRFDWTAHGAVTLNDRGHLVVATLPAVPGIYRWTLTGRPGQPRPEVYIGEGGSLRRRIGDYRRPSKMRTAGQLHRQFVEHIRDGGRVALEIATEVEIETVAGATSVPLTRSTARHLAEHAAIALTYIDGAVTLLNADSAAG